MLDIREDDECVVAFEFFLGFLEDDALGGGVDAVEVVESFGD